ADLEDIEPAGIAEDVVTKAEVQRQVVEVLRRRRPGGRRRKHASPQRQERDQAYQQTDPSSHDDLPPAGLGPRYPAPQLAYAQERCRTYADGMEILGPAAARL